MERVVFVLWIKKGLEDEYVLRHKNVWPEVLEDLSHAGVHALEIYLVEPQAIVIMDVHSYEASAAYLSKAPASIRWEEFMAPLMIGESGGAYDPENAWPSGVPAVFRWKANEN
jgi:L-rhamnose mutarotase